jgi:hypothetical protein
MDKNFYVYGLFDPKKDKPFYIGKGTGRRYTSHFEPSRLKQERKSLKAKIYLKIINEGNLPISKILFNNLTEDEAFLKERELIAKYGRIDKGSGCLANHTDGGEGVAGIILQEDSIIKRSNALKDVPRPLYVRKKISETLKGRIRSKETLEKISKAKAGKIYPNVIEANKKNAIKRKGIPRTEEVKLKLSLSQKGRIVPPERRLQISNTLKKTYKLYDTNGELLIIYDMVKFCKKNNFGKSARNCLAMLANKGFYNGRSNGKIYKYTSYKGYTSTIT